MFYGFERDEETEKKLTSNNCCDILVKKIRTKTESPNFGTFCVETIFHTQLSIVKTYKLH